MRTHTCGQLTAAQLDQEVTLCGWAATRRDHGGVIFIDLRDRYGLTQVVFDPETPGSGDAHKSAHSIRSEFVLRCRGRVRRRPQGMTNTKLATGEIEVAVTHLEILSEAKTPPFPIEDEVDVHENMRLKYRYLDLRRPSLQKNLVTRHKVTSIIRESLSKDGFLEIETPILYKSTPEGARDFIVPSRMNPGTFFALPQSPQLLKQLLMISGMDRYFQVCRCFRDEDLRADRQPEFSQIDIEASFIDEEILFPVIERVIVKLWKELMGKDLKTPFPRMAFKEAMNRFGSDKPDVRFGLELRDLSEVFAKSEFKVLSAALAPDSRGKRGSIRAIALEGQAERFSRKDLDDLSAHAVRHGAKGLLWIKVQEGGELQSPAAKFFSEAEKANLARTLSLKPGSLVVMVADPNDEKACEAMGAVRLWMGEKLGLIPKPGQGDPAFLWVTDFLLLQYESKDGRYYARHHPFTSPRREHLADFVNGKRLDDIEASAYDLVLNGVEIGGGSLRIHRQDTQSAMFKALGIGPDEAKQKFGFFLEALQYGTPPHGGIALGLDRLTAILCGVGPIRDVMAFPKTQKGHCLMSECPSPVDAGQLAELGVALSAPPKPAE